MTNFEKITASPEKLAEWIAERIDCDVCPCVFGVCREIVANCDYKIALYLNQEAAK